jgi:hypothetical protein
MEPFDNVFSAIEILYQPDASEVVLEDSEIIKITKGESSGHGKIAKIKDTSRSNNNLMTNSSRTGGINNYIIVSSNTSSNKNIFFNKKKYY